MKEIMAYLLMIILACNYLYHWIIMEKMTKDKIERLNQLIERYMQHHWQLKKEVDDLKKEAQ